MPSGMPQRISRAGQDLGAAVLHLHTQAVRGGLVFAVAAAFDHAEQAVTQLAFQLGGELHRDDRFIAKGIIEQRPETLAHAGGVDHDPQRVPGLHQRLQGPEHLDVLLPGPFLAQDGQIGGFAEQPDGACVDLNDLEGGAVAVGVGE